MASVVVRTDGLRVVSLFSGIGGLDYAVRRLFRDARTVCYVENELQNVARLVANMERGWLDSAPVWSDVRTFDGYELEDRVELLVGGFPCQDLSKAGRRAGIGGQRSGLWRQCARLIDEIRPAYVFLENVAAIVSGRSLDTVVGTLANLGYDAEWGCLSAADVGAPHRRNRWWCLAERRGMADTARQRVSAALRPEPTQAVATRAGGLRGATLGDTNCQGLEIWAGVGCDAVQEHPAIVGTGYRDIPPWPPAPGDHAGWRDIISRYPDLAPATEPAFCGVADGTPDHLGVCVCGRQDQLHGLGNGVVPACAELAFRLLWARLVANVHPIFT